LAFGSRLHEYIPEFSGKIFYSVPGAIIIKNILRKVSGHKLAHSKK
jgi:hypothetical protein